MTAAIIICALVFLCSACFRCPEDGSGKNDVSKWSAICFIACLASVIGLQVLEKLA